MNTTTLTVRLAKNVSRLTVANVGGAKLESHRLRSGRCGSLVPRREFVNCGDAAVTCDMCAFREIVRHT